MRRKQRVDSVSATSRRLIYAAVAASGLGSAFSVSGLRLSVPGLGGSWAWGFLGLGVLGLGGSWARRSRARRWLGTRAPTLSAG